MTEHLLNSMATNEVREEGNRNIARRLWWCPGDSSNLEFVPLVHAGHHWRCPVRGVYCNSSTIAVVRGIADALELVQVSVPITFPHCIQFLNLKVRMLIFFVSPQVYLLAVCFSLTFQSLCKHISHSLHILLNKHISPWCYIPSAH